MADLRASDKKVIPKEIRQKIISAKVHILASMQYLDVILNSRNDNLIAKYGKDALHYYHTILFNAFRGLSKIIPNLSSE